LPVAIINQDHSSASRLLMNRLDTIPKIKLHSYDDLARARADMRELKLFAIILIPIDFEKSLLNGKYYGTRLLVMVLIDLQRPNTARNFLCLYSVVKRI